MKNNLFPTLCFLFVIFSCNPKTETREAETETIKEFPETIEMPIPTGDNSQNALDWAGSYEGTLPCADCEGIETTLALNDDLTYQMNTNYLGRNDALEEETSGTFSWDENGAVITLENKTEAENRFKIGEGRIWALDSNGDMITGDLANHYILKKIDK